MQGHILGVFDANMLNLRIHGKRQHLIRQLVVAYEQKPLGHIIDRNIRWRQVHRESGKPHSITLHEIVGQPRIIVLRYDQKSTLGFDPFELRALLRLAIQSRSIPVHILHAYPPLVLHRIEDFLEVSKRHSMA